MQTYVNKVEQWLARLEQENLVLKRRMVTHPFFATNVDSGHASTSHSDNLDNLTGMRSGIDAIGPLIAESEQILKSSALEIHLSSNSLSAELYPYHSPHVHPYFEFPPCRGCQSAQFTI